MSPPWRCRLQARGRGYRSGYPGAHAAQGGHDTVPMIGSADARVRVQTRIRWELLANLVRKDLKVKYQGSVLGFLWSLANPLLLLAVYTFVFQLVLRSGIPQFGFFLLSGLNVRYRDTQHIVEVALMAGFWLNPIVYSVALVRDHLHGWAYLLYYLNPMAGIAITFQRALYAQDPVLPTGHRVLADPGYQFYLERLGLGAAVSGLLLLLGLRVYHRLSADFAEEL